MLRREAYEFRMCNYSETLHRSLLKGLGEPFPVAGVYSDEEKGADIKSGNNSPLSRGGFAAGLLIS